MSAVLDWYRARNASEQRLLLMATVIVPLMVATLLLTTLYRNVAATTARLEKKQQDLGWLQANASQLGAAVTAPARGNESLVTLIDRVARETGVAQALTGSQSSGNGGLRVRAEKAAFDALVAFLGALSTQHGVIIDSATIEGVGTAGVVNATLVLHKD